MRSVAFLRSINVGGRRVTGDVLTATFTSLGLTGVSTFLASGNVLFDDPGAEPEEIEAALERDLGYPVPVVLRTGAAVGSLAAGVPFTEAQLEPTERRVQIMLVRDSPGPAAVERAIGDLKGPDLFETVDDDVFWLPRTGVSGSDLDIPALERVLGPITVRTHNTLVRLADRL